MLSNSRQAEPSGQPEFTVLASGFWLLAPAFLPADRSTLRLLLLLAKPQGRNSCPAFEGTGKVSGVVVP